jgi:ribonuclease G
LPEWLYDAGIGEARAALVDDGRIVEALVEPDGDAPRVGAMVEARLVERLSPALARVEWPGGAAMLTRRPLAVTVGASLLVEIVREAIPEPRLVKLPKAVPAPPGATPRPGPDLLARIQATGFPVHRPLPHQPDRLEEAGWSEVLAEAETGEVAFPGGLLRIAPTPAMTVIDVDGQPPLDALALAAATAAGSAIRRLGIAGSIGIDFPTLPDKPARLRVAEAIDRALPLPFERTAVNGFGFLQIVRPRHRRSLPELLAADPLAATARAALRQLERTPPGQPAPVRLPPAVLARIEAAGWRAELARRLGRDLLETAP